MMAPLLADLLWPIFLLLGVEHVRIRSSPNPFLRLDLYDFPWSHSLLMALVWSLVVGGVYALIARYRRGGIVVGVGVFSHWLLDFVSHAPDMPLYPGGAKVGLGLWNVPVATVVVETAMFVFGLMLYLRTTRPRDRVGSIGMWSYVALLVLGYAGSIVAAPPSDWHAIAWTGVASWLFIIWIAWFDRHRAVRSTQV